MSGKVVEEANNASMEVVREISQDKFKTSDLNFVEEDGASPPLELTFEGEINDAPGFESESIYDLDSMEEKRLSKVNPGSPPPNFQSSLQSFPKNLQETFKEILHGEIVGIWPIKSDIFLKGD